MNEIKSKVDHRDDPGTVLNKASEMATFLSFVADQVGFHRCGDGMPEEAWYGLSTILDDMRERITTANVAFDELLEIKEVATLARVGLPEQAYADGTLREAWRSGFAHGRRASAQRDARQERFQTALSEALQEGSDHGTQ